MGNECKLRVVNMGFSTIEKDEIKRPMENLVINSIENR